MRIACNSYHDHCHQRAQNQSLTRPVLGHPKTKPEWRSLHLASTYLYINYIWYMIYSSHSLSFQPSQLVLAWPALEEQRWQLNYKYWQVLQLNSRSRNGNDAIDAMLLIKRSPRVADTDRSQVETTGRGSGNRRSWKFCVWASLCLQLCVCFEVTLDEIKTLIDCWPWSVQGDVVASHLRIAARSLRPTPRSLHQ